MIIVDKRNWSFRDISLNERAKADYRRLRDKVRRGNLYFDEVYYQQEGRALSLHGVCVEEYLLSISYTHPHKLLLTFPKAFSESIYANPNHLYVWERPIKQKKYFWVLVDVPNVGKRWYQLPKDLQKAMWLHVKNQNGDWKKLLLDAFINVPISNYENGYARLTVGRVQRISIKKLKATNSAKITRSQFVKPEKSKYGFESISSNQIQFMKHDFSESNRSTIARELHIAIFKHNVQLIINNRTFLIASFALMMAVLTFILTM